MIKQTRAVSVRVLWTALAALAFSAATAPARERGQHAIGVQPFLIPMAGEVESTTGWGYEADYEYAVTDKLGLFVGYLHAEYDDEWKMPNVRHPGYWIYDRDEVTLEGPVFGARYRLNFDTAKGPGPFHLLLGLNVGLWSKDDIEATDGGAKESEDVQAAYLTGALGWETDHWDFALGSDIGAMSGDEGGGFATVFFRTSYRFSVPFGRTAKR